MKTIIAALVFLMSVVNVQAYDVGARTLIKGSVEVTTGTSLTYRGFFSNLTKSSGSSQYLGVTKQLASWIGIEGVVGTTANAGTNSPLLRGDVWMAKDHFTSYNFVEVYTKYEAIGVCNNLDVAFGKVHLGVESYVYISKSGNGYDFGPLVGAEVSRNLRVNLIEFFHGRGTRPTTLIGGNISF